jgi:ATP-dependent DNA helicase DinG
VRTGAQYLALPAARIGLASPFDYAAQTRIFIVTDVGRDADAEVAAAVRDLFLAARGGGLGLFTSIARLRAVHGRIAQDLADAGLTLLAQHVDGLDAGTLVDIFRADRESCLLGTDAVRDGVDVPGRALRLIVFDRVPWPRPDILHRARREHFGAGYDDILTRLRLKQAYGRLIRRADDHGVFIMLDSRLPTRLCSAFPEDVAIERLPLAEVIGQTGHFLSGFPRT